LLLERFHLHLGLLQIRLLRGQHLDPGVLFIQLLLPGVIEEAKHQETKNQARANENAGSAAPVSTGRRADFRSNLSKQVYSNHG